MSIKAFLELVEIRTKIASVYPFVLGTLFVFYKLQTINLGNTLIFFVAMLIFDLTTTAINNYMDYRKATDNHDYDFRVESNVIGKMNIPQKKRHFIDFYDVSHSYGSWCMACSSNRFIGTFDWLCMFLYWHFIYIWTSSIIAHAAWRSVFRRNNGIWDFLFGNLHECV
ncbi:1,4-dihydroxy-2-naphthoate octaprenyltransferase [Listeria aquatica FSL S10-1188]|uniref:1,4-dihydroxy-2-naphthoate octaprenyltransferase n=1 Tax=Listeria aquatica FSL S10-1188 TaxID=1265818 RepID=W7BF88_9LIST|nr:1,4-dihydroxy-2-naphthoate octaprenyltransferase [Listeria aquatica FSL S10-1188]